jgi:hypothetical protein
MLPLARRRQVAALIEDQKLDEAEKQLNEAIREFPKDAHVHLLLGHLHCARSRFQACLASYRTAVVLDGQVREDPTLLEWVGQLLRRTKGHLWGMEERKAAMEFIIRSHPDSSSLGSGTKKLLVEYANTWWEVERVWEAIALLKPRNADGDIDYRHAYELKFRTVIPCKERSQIIQEIVARKDKAFVPLLQKVYKSRRLRAKFTKVSVPTECIREDLKKAILALGGKVPKLDAPKVKRRRRSSRRRRRRRRRRR